MKINSPDIQITIHIEGDLHVHVDDKDRVSVDADGNVFRMFNANDKGTTSGSHLAWGEPDKFDPEKTLRGTHRVTGGDDEGCKCKHEGVYVRPEPNSDLPSS